MSVLLCCTNCKELFRSRSALNNHVRYNHQLTAKVRFSNGAVGEIAKGENNAFTCNCGKVFRHPRSLLRHTKQCDGAPENGAELNDGAELADSMSQPENSITENKTLEAEDFEDYIGI
jgi:hypothetical protein